jgi:DNA-binding SARP family transcriptional activator
VLRQHRSHTSRRGRDSLSWRVEQRSNRPADSGAPPAQPKRRDQRVAHLALLKGFQLSLDGQPIELPLSAQRLIAFLALNDHPVQRDFVAGTLWLETTDERAAANLRSALWRLHRHGDLIDATGSQLRLSPRISIDLKEAATCARQVLDGVPPSQEGDQEPFHLSLGSDLLPDWYEDWVLIERERFRQLRLHALESLCEQLTNTGRFAQAIEAGLTAVAAEPLRESAHRALIRTFLAEGNRGEAIRQYRRYDELLREGLGVAPSEQIRQLVGSLPGDAPVTP